MNRRITRFEQSKQEKLNEKKPPKEVPPRIHLLAAKAAPYVVIIRQKPTRVVHVIKWNTANDQFEHGSWFNGRIFAMRSDLSFDGKHMVYLAMGSHGQTWTGICEPPSLKTSFDWDNHGTYQGGGVFAENDLLYINSIFPDDVASAVMTSDTTLPFRIEPMRDQRLSGDTGILYPRWMRDGFERAGPLPPLVCEKDKWIRHDDPGWIIRPAKNIPILRIRERGEGEPLEWDLPDHPGFLDRHVSWATYDYLGQLIVARKGIVSRYSYRDLKSLKPSAQFDFNEIERPTRNQI